VNTERRQKLRLEALEPRLLLAAGPWGQGPAPLGSEAERLDASLATVSQTADEDRSGTFGERTQLDWTVMVFANGDNDLEAWVIKEINQMEAARLPETVRVVVQLDRCPGRSNARIPWWDKEGGNWTDTRRGEIVYDGGASRISSELELADPGNPELNMGDGETLRDFVEWAVTNYPAEHYALVISDHGGGLYGVSYDDEPDDHIEMGELYEALAAVPARLDVVSADACLMQMVEVGAQLVGEADYFVAMQRVGCASSWGYSIFLRWLGRHPDASGDEFAKEIVRAVRAVGRNPTVSAIDVNQLPALSQALDEFGAVAVEHLSHEVWDRLHWVRRRTPCGGHMYMYMTDFRDLRSFMRLVERDAELPSVLREAATRVLRVLGGVVLPGWKGLGGLSVYMPQEGVHVSSDYSTEQLRLLNPESDFGAPNWVEFVRAMNYPPEYTDGVPDEPGQRVLTVGDSARKTATFEEADGDRVFIGLSGPGLVQVWLGAQDSGIARIEFQGATRRTSLRVRVSGKGTTTIGCIEAVDQELGVLDLEADLGDLGIGGDVRAIRIRGGIQGEIRVAGSLRSLVADDWVTSTTLEVAGDLGYFRTAFLCRSEISVGGDLAKLVAPKLREAHLDVDGAAGLVQCGRAGRWFVRNMSLDVAEELRLLRLGDLLLARVEAASVRSFLTGRATGVSVEVQGTLRYLRAADWHGGSILASNINVMRVTGRRWVEGDFKGTLRLTGSGSDGEELVLRSLTVAGNVLDADLEVNARVGRVWVGGDFSGSLTATSLGSLTVRGDMASSSIELTQTVDPRSPALTSFYVRGWMRESTLQVVGNVARISVGGMVSSSVFAGVTGALLPEDASAFATQATIQRFVQRGIREKGRRVEGFLDSNVAAWHVTRCSLREVRLDNQGLTFGIAAVDLDLLTWRQGPFLYRWPARRAQDWPADSGDFTVREFG